MKLKLHAYELPLRHTFTISRESIDTQPTLIVELQDDGVSGFGEATSNRYYGFTVESMSQRLELLRQEIETAKWQTPEEFWAQMQPHLADDPFALCALDQAAHDLWGKRLNKPVYELWGLTTEKIPASNYTIGIDTIPKMLEKMAEFPDWPIYKIKLGTDRDLEIVRELRAHTSAAFRVDANCGWSADQTLKYAPQLRELGVEFIEQPLPANQWEEIRRVRASVALPIMADESCIVESDVPRCSGLFHGINIKLVKCGGLTPARRMIAKARELGLKVMVGCMTESTVGISAIAQLLPLLDYVDMDGAVLLARDIATGVRVERGICHYPNVPGNGVQLLS
ncbi:L-Ala-D/L-Glu epimerase [Anatilimnocola aggregata]|uniref:Dipeptide epimerase n=1 Tax=Anatilimnocola aggregata TaxID=2528021 RepID=A0A517YMP9_9BACT|nr:dipeptide epimerase [Anatilimnocola aggregata]QDU31493.1 L-Ala-D/L-Glu epimerase [Anatilimnocola aggregata]